MNLHSEFDIIYDRNVDLVYRICFIYMKNKVDSEDMTQNTFMKYLRYKPKFENVKHEKAWFIVTATNICKNHFKSWWNKNTNLKDELEVAITDKDNEIIETITSLPKKYKQVIYMFYYEGYKTKEISTILNINESTIRSHLQKGRNMLKEKLGSVEL